MDLSEMRSIAGVNAILLMSQLGNLGGDALLDVLTGKVNPSQQIHGQKIIWIIHLPQNSVIMRVYMMKCTKMVSMLDIAILTALV